MDKNIPITIEKVGNGFFVRPSNSISVMALSDVMVFHDMGFASASRDNQDAKNTLLGFIADHFTD